MIARVLSLGLLVALVAAVAAPVAVPAPSRQRHAQSALVAGVLEKLNAIRVAHGLAPLRPSQSLTVAAEFHSRELAGGGYFSHSSSNGDAFWKRIERWYAPEPNRTWAVGENLLWSTPGVDADEALADWMKSPPHRENILSGSWRDVGIAAVHVSRAGGVFGHGPVTILTADFGSR